MNILEQIMGTSSRTENTGKALTHIWSLSGWCVWITCYSLLGFLCLSNNATLLPRVLGQEYFQIESKSSDWQKEGFLILTEKMSESPMFSTFRGDSLMSFLYSWCSWWEEAEESRRVLLERPVAWAIAAGDPAWQVSVDFIKGSLHVQS